STKSPSRAEQPAGWRVPAGWTLIYRPSTGSTNDDAKTAAHDWAGERRIFLADEQTAGRGRYGRSWIAPAGTCLLTSLLLEETLTPLECTAATSVALAEMLASELALPA